MLEVVNILTRAAANLFPLQWTLSKDCQEQTVCREKVACSFWPWMCLFGFQWWTRSIAVQKYKSCCAAFGTLGHTWGCALFVEYWGLCFKSGRDTPFFGISFSDLAQGSQHSTPQFIPPYSAPTTWVIGRKAGRGGADRKHRCLPSWFWKQWD